ncbi:MAG TPA: nucleoside phosphorylase, partial [Stellaceae bacterium]|nr:nucleoside phosphorylase [Stellaceae bacterium]
RASGRGQLSKAWACYHTDLYEFDIGGERFGIIGCAVGASFAVLLAEQLFVSGCRFLISVTSAGQITTLGPPPYFVVIDRALRDEGTSYHYLPPAEFAEADPRLVGAMMEASTTLAEPLYQGASWTTDAPYRETETAIARNQARKILAVEMEAAALYAFAKARDKAVLCFAHVTNQMAVNEGDFEKGESDGTRASLEVIAAAARVWRRLTESKSAAA